MNKILFFLLLLSNIAQAQVIGSPSFEAVGISVGSTVITGGTTGRVLFDNAGLLGEYTISGTGSVCMTTSCILNAKTLNSVRYADQFAGATAGAKIQAAIDDLPSTGGTVDARGLEGAQVISTTVTVGSTTKPVQLLLGAATYTVSATILVSSKSSIVGLPAGMGIGSTTGPSMLIMAASTNLSSVVKLQDHYNVLQDITVDGNKANNASGGDAILIDRSARSSLFRVTAQNAKAHGVHIFSTYAGGTSDACCGKLLQVMSINNDGSGLYIENTNDTFVLQSEFENNTGSGISLDNSSATRIENSDISGNHVDGLKMFVAGTPTLYSSNNIVIGNQFGNNYQHDIDIIGGTGYNSQVNTIVSNQFIGSVNRTSNSYDAIHIEDSAYNTLEANLIASGAGHTFRYGVGIYETTPGTEGRDNIVNGTFTGTFGTGTIKLVATTYAAANNELAGQITRYTGIGVFGTHGSNDVVIGNSANIAGYAGIGMFTSGTTSTINAIAGGVQFYDLVINANDFNVGPQGGSTAFSVKSTNLVTLPLITTDATHTDTTVCQDTTTHALYLGSGTAGVCLGNVSSARFKNNMVDLSDGLSEVLRLRPINYFYNADVGDHGVREQYGFTAENAADVLPKLTRFAEDGTPNGVDILGMVPVLVRAIQEQQKRIEALEARR